MDKVAGPSGAYPVLGHAVYLSRKQPFKQIDDWSKQYGDVMQITLGMHPVVVISR